MKKMKKFVLVVLAMVMVLTFAGCNKKRADEKLNKDLIYRMESLNINVDADEDAENVYFVDDGLIISSGKYDEDAGKWIYWLYKFDKAGQKLWKTTIDDASYYDYVLPTSDGGVVVTYSSYFEDYSDPDNYIWENYYYMVKVDGNGKVVKNVDMKKEYEIDGGQLYKLPGDQFLFSSYGDSFYVFDKDLKLVNKKERDSASAFYFSSIYAMRDGSVIAFGWGDNGQEFRKFDVNKLETGDKIDVADFSYNFSIYPGKACDFILIDSTQVYKYNIGDADITPILNFIDSDIDVSYFNSFEAISDTEFLVSYWDWSDNGNGGQVISKLTKVNPEDVKDKIVIKLGCEYLYYDIRDKIYEFNRENDEYHISVIDYSIYDSEANEYRGAQEKMATDIASGNGPDFIVADNYYAIANYIDKGMFTDLEPIMKKDEEFDYDDFLPNIIEALKKDGKLYAMSSSFNVNTVIAKKSIVGDKNTWTMDDMRAVEKTLSDGAVLWSGLDRSSMMYQFLSFSGDTFADLSKGKCSFDSQAFIDLLEYVKTIPENTNDFWSQFEDDWESYDTMYRRNRVICNARSFYGINSYKYQLRGYYGEPLAMIGYPTESGNGSSISLGTVFCICAKSNHKDVSWDFIKQFLSKENMGKNIDSYTFPTRKSLFEECVKKGMERNSYVDYETGETIYYDDYFYLGNQQITMDPLTQEEVDEFSNWVYSVNKLSTNIDELLTIIEEEAEAFYQGQKSAEEVAKIIQSRAFLYINEKQ